LALPFRINVEVQLPPLASTMKTQVEEKIGSGLGKTCLNFDELQRTLGKLGNLTRRDVSSMLYIMDERYSFFSNNINNLYKIIITKIKI
jgi:hypothetical protein